MPFKISLAEWSLHRSIWNKKIDHLDFAELSTKTFGIDAIEYVNTFFLDKAKNINIFGLCFSIFTMDSNFSFLVFNNEKNARWSWGSK